jgi:hypothetical protein
LTERKDSPLVEIPIISPQPQEVETANILATWSYGLGRTAVFTSDAGKRWAADWVGSAYYDQFFSQLVRWTMRPSNDDGKYSVATQAKDGRVQIIVNALDANDKFLNFMDMSATAIGPDLKPISVPLNQQAPGRYVGEFVPESAGSFMVSVSPGAGKANITTGVTVPFSDEYRVRQANMRLLEQLAEQKPNGGEPGELAPALEQGNLEELVGIDTYRPGLPPAKSLKDIWPLAVLIGSTLFFADVFVRRVALDLGAPLRAIARWLGRSRTSGADQQRQKSLDQLRKSKSQVSGDLERQRSAVTFEVTEVEEGPGRSSASFGAEPSTGKPNVAATAKPSMQTEDDQSYTSRLLEAKRKAKKNNP